MSFRGRSLGLFLSLMAACSDRPSASSELESSEAPSLSGSRIEFAGCASVLAGRRCVLEPERSLRVWVPAGAAIEARSMPGGPLTTRSEPAGSGMLHHVVLPPDARALELIDGRGRLLFSLALLKPDNVPAIEQAKALRARGEFAEARRLLELARHGLTDMQRGRADALRARLALSEGDHAQAVAGLRASLAEAEAQGRISDAVQDATALAFVLCTNLREYGEARSVLAQASRLAAQDPAARALIPHYFGVLALETGDIRSALDAFREAIARTERLGLRDHELLAREEYASALATLGRHDEAVRVQERVVAEFESDDVCVQADRSEVVTWFVLQAEASPESELGRKARHFSALAEALLERCKSPWSRRNHRINASLLALADRDAARADALLSDLPALDGEDRLLAVWELEAKGRLGLLRRDWPGALRAFDRARDLAEHTGLWENSYLAWLGRARALDGAKRAESALRSYLSARDVLARASSWVPLSEGQAGFQHAREAGTHELIELLVRLGRTEEALATARAARVRVIASASGEARLSRLDPSQRAAWERAVARYRALRERVERARAEAWQVPADRRPAQLRQLEGLQRAAQQGLDQAHALLQPSAAVLAAPESLPAPASDEVTLAFLPAQSGLRAFALAASGQVTTRLMAISLPRRAPLQLSEAERAALGASLLGPFREQLKAARRVRVLTHADLSALDVHALELDGAALVEQLPVTYSLDLPDGPPEPKPGGASALLVGNPTEDLAAAEREAKSVQALLDLERPVFLTGAAATRSEVLLRLSEVDLFHYAGHARYSGLEGIDSHLVLADGVLTLGDILNLSHAPARVVLSACEGAASEAPGYAGGLGLAQAFVAAGSRAVVAAARPVRDQLAREFVELFYAELARPRDGASGPEDAARALQQATLRLRARSADADWAAFRLITR